MKWFTGGTTNLLELPSLAGSFWQDQRGSFAGSAFTVYRLNFYNEMWVETPRPQLLNLTVNDYLENFKIT